MPEELLSFPPPALFLQSPKLENRFPPPWESLGRVGFFVQQLLAGTGRHWEGGSPHPLSGGPFQHKPLVLTGFCVCAERAQELWVPSHAPLPRHRTAA